MCRQKTFKALLYGGAFLFKTSGEKYGQVARKSYYELKNVYEELVFYLFIEKRNKSEKQYCKSFIQESKIDYTYGQTKMTLLYKEKINKITGDVIIQYDRLSEK